MACTWGISATLSETFHLAFIEEIGQYPLSVLTDLKVAFIQFTTLSAHPKITSSVPGLHVTICDCSVVSYIYPNMLYSPAASKTKDKAPKLVILTSIILKGLQRADDTNLQNETTPSHYTWIAFLVTRGLRGTLCPFPLFLSTSYLKTQLVQ